MTYFPNNKEFLILGLHVVVITHTSCPQKKVTIKRENSDDGFMTI